ncbi:reverse transcriptase domain-containing protein [Bacillus cereus]|uniref:reverse transcriptase domain-containing protein n=1 Tax=Bacillus cereus TaxID=1396 RepID=UPI000BF6EDF7|nr:reverse transcriptase domain-containing protein [Bacillus cereus]
MISKRDFNSSIDKEFWNTITKKLKYEDVIKFNDVDKGSFLMALINDINSYNYNVSTPNYYFLAKSNGVLRRTKVFNLKDFTIYYYCVKKLQDELSEKINQISNVFGGFKFSADNKSVTQNFFEDLSESDYEVLLSKNAFRKDWSDYQNLAKEAYKDGFKYFLHIDIAHFYDDINLDILERFIRNEIKNKPEIIDLLFSFLRLSDKRDIGYSSNNVGIPQEELGAMSRILANFYLVRFDEEIIKFLNDFLGRDQYVYLRYSDDIWICFNENRISANKIIQTSSLLLNKLKLHINQKTQVYTRKKFESYWMFNEWDTIKKHTKDKQYLLNRYFMFVKQKKGRWSSISKYILKIIISDKKSISLFKNYSEGRDLLFSIIENPDFSSNLEEKHYQFFVDLIHKYPQLVDELIKYIYSPKNIYPNVEYFILNLLTRCSYNKSVFIFMKKYLDYKKENIFHWYSRCLCIKYICKNLSYVTDKSIIIESINLVISSNISRIFNEYERRYIIYFLYLYGNTQSDKILKANFKLPNDLAFLSFLENMKK